MRCHCRYGRNNASTFSLRTVPRQNGRILSKDPVTGCLRAAKEAAGTIQLPRRRFHLSCCVYRENLLNIIWICCWTKQAGFCDRYGDPGEIEQSCQCCHIQPRTMLRSRFGQSHWRTRPHITRWCLMYGDGMAARQVTYQCAFNVTAQSLPNSNGVVKANLHSTSHLGDHGMERDRPTFIAPAT